MVILFLGGVFFSSLSVDWLTKPRVNKRKRGRNDSAADDDRKR